MEEPETLPWVWAVDAGDGAPAQARLAGEGVQRGPGGGEAASVGSSETSELAAAPAPAPAATAATVPLKLSTCTVTKRGMDCKEGLRCPPGGALATAT